MAYIPEGCAAIQQDLDKLKNFAETNLTRFNKDGCGVLHLWRNNPKSQHRLGPELLESSSVEKDVEVSVDGRLTISWQCPGGQEGQWDLGVHWEECGQQVEGGDPASQNTGIL